MKRKEVEDVMGGKEAWANVDQADGESCAFCLLFLRYGREVGGGGGGGGGKGIKQGIRADMYGINSAMSPRKLRWRQGVFLPGADSECGRADDDVL